MKRLRQTLAVVLAVVMLISVLPFAVNAQDTDIDYSVSAVNGTAFDGTQPITVGDTIAVDVTLKRTLPEMIFGWMTGFSYDSSVLTLESIDFDLSKWVILEDFDQSGTDQLIGARIDYKLAPNYEDNFGTEIKVATLNFTAVASGEASISANAGNKNYFSVSTDGLSVDTKAIESASTTAFTVYEKTDKTELERQLGIAATLEEDDYIPTTWTPFVSAKAAAQLVEDNAFASQTEIDKAAQDLADAISNLVEAANKLALINAVNRANQLIAQTGVYTDESIAALQAAVNEANDVIDDDNAIQTTVDAQTAKVNKAIEDLVKNEITVTFLDANGDTFAVRTVPYGGTVEIPEGTPVKESTAEYDFTFDHWDGQLSNITAPTTVTPVFTQSAREYTVVFQDEDGSEIATQTYTYNQTITPPAEPSKEATAQYTYSFAGWSPELASVTQNAVYTATYSSTVNKYTVTFLNEDGSVYDEVECEYGTVPQAKGTPTKAASDEFTYVFAGWDIPVVAVTGNATYKATFTSSINAYTIIFLDEDGTQIGEPQTLDYGAQVVVPADPTKEADLENTYTFAGWSPEVALTVTGNATYTATYTATKIDYSISFLDEDGTQIGETQVLHYGDPVVIPESPSKDADAQYTYTFAGWSPAVEATVIGDATYTATYSSILNSYKITFLNEDGSIYDEVTCEYGSVPAPKGTPDKDANVQYTYTFAGWDKELEAVTGEATYQATFSATVNKYTVTFYNGEAVFATETYAYGAIPTAPEGTPEKASDNTYYYTFKGWTPAFAEVTGDTSYTAEFEEHYLDADYTAVNEAVAAAAAYDDSSKYTEISYARLFAAVGAVEYGLKINAQEKVNKFAEDINAAIAALVSDTAYKEAFAKCKAVNNDSGVYTQESYAAFVQAFTPISTEIDFNTAQATQAEVDAATKALNDAYSLLEATELRIDGYKSDLSDNEILTSSNTSLTTTALFANDGGAGTAQLKFYDAQGVELTDQNKRIGNGFKVELVQFGEIRFTKTLVIYGDINGDGQVSLSDIKLARKMAVSEEGFTAIQILAAKCGGTEVDVNKVIELAMAI